MSFKHPLDVLHKYFLKDAINGLKQQTAAQLAHSPTRAHLHPVVDGYLLLYQV